MKPIEVVWSRILQHEGERFETLTGRPFTYTVTGHVLRTDRTDFNLPRSQFEKALDLVVGHHPLADPGCAGSQDCDRDRVFVDVEPDVSTLVHGRSLRMSAPRACFRG